MLQEFRVDNFKSLINIVFKPQEANLLIGANNAGKTNLCQAMRFVSASSFFTLDVCADQTVNGRVGMTNFALDKSTIDFFVRADMPYEEEHLTFEYTLTISPPQDRLREVAVTIDREVLSVSGGAFDQTLLLNNKFGQIRLLHENDFLGGEQHYVAMTAPRDATMLQRLYDTNTNPRANRFKQYLTAWTYYDLSPSAMRGSAHKPREYVIATDGSNLASVLYSLKTGNERAYRKLLEVIQRIEPRLDLINFFAGSENNVFMYFEDEDAHALSTVNASSGTLRFLALAYVLLVQPRLGLSPVCIVEEPENGIYVGFLKTLFEMIEGYPDRPQVIFTSHSPYFIDLFDEHLGGVFVLDRDKGHTAISQPDVAKVKARLEQFPLGEQHYREMLG